MASFYSGKYKVKNRSKYKGNPETIKYRSGWERSCFIYCDTSDRVVSWASESIVIPYHNKLDGVTRRYFPDLYIEWNDGTKEIIEIKPSRETKPPVQKNPMGRRPSKKYLSEAATYIVNQSKWESASNYAHSRDWKFSIWDENKIKSLGIKII